MGVNIARRENTSMPLVMHSTALISDSCFFSIAVPSANTSYPLPTRSLPHFGDSSSWPSLGEGCGGSGRDGRQRRRRSQDC